MTLKYSHSFSFDGGLLEVKTSGHGDKDGSGLFVFDEETANWEAREERSGCDIVVTCAKPDMIELRDFLNRMYPIEPPSPQPGDNLTPDSAAVRLYAALEQISIDDAVGRLDLYYSQTAISALASAHEHLCSERIAAAEKAARVKALEEAIEIVKAELCGACRAYGDFIKPLQALITAAEAQPGTEKSE